jgi:hypothetical protein
MTAKIQTTKFFSSQEPRVYPAPARQLQVGDEWINGDVTKTWNGTAWAEKSAEKQDDKKEAATKLGIGKKLS